MIRERDPFGRALDALRERLRTGGYAPGQALAIVDLARELDLSPTPVREALSRLAGQGLVEDRRGRGYFNRRLDVVDLIELYDLSDLHVGWALARLAGGCGSRRRVGAESALALLAAAREVAPPPRSLGAFTETLLARVILAAGNHALAASHANLADRLGPARRLEPVVIDDVETELTLLANLVDREDWAGLREAYGRFQARRRQAAGAIVAQLREDDLTIRNI